MEIVKNDFNDNLKKIYSFVSLAFAQLKVRVLRLTY